MTVALPRDILNRLERRWTARVTQTESFHAKTDRLKQNIKPVVEGAEPPADEPEFPAWQEPSIRN